MTETPSRTEPRPSHTGGVLDEAPPGTILRAAFLIGPFAVVAAAVALMWLVRGGEVATEMLEATAACATFLGTSVILGPALLDGSAIAHLSTWDLVGIVTVVNAGTSFLYAFNLDLFERAPWIGPRLVRERHAAVETLKARPWIRRRATLGVFLFVLSPLPGSGTLGGTIVGRLIGLSRWQSFLTTLGASVAVAGIYGAFGDRIHAWVHAHEISTPIRIGGLLALLVLVYGLFRWLVRIYRAEPPAG